jgi:uncharacterized Rmd1/YagE family protein
MRCTAYCTAASYHLPTLIGLLKSQFQTTVYRDAIHTLYSSQKGHAFFFSYGVVVFWGMNEEEEFVLKEKIRVVESEPILSPEIDVYDYSLGENWKIQRDEIVLTNDEVLTMLAVSYGLAQSIKLALFERRIDKTIQKTKHLPEDLAKKGKISLSRKEISQKIGELFIDRSSVNLHSDVLDEPEFFWEYPEHHIIYRDVSKCLDISPRIEVLNNRLTIVSELLRILNDQLNHHHSSILEWTIIWLIVIEVVLALLRDLFHLI